MAPQDAVFGWDEDDNARAYDAFTRAHPMYDATSRDLARRSNLTDADLVVDLCGGAGATARAILDLVQAHTRVTSLDSASAMQRVGRRALPDPRLTWVTAPAEQLAEHVPHGIDAVVCNSAIWKTDTRKVFSAVARLLRPGGRFAFNVGGGFAGVRHPEDQSTERTGPSLNALIHQVAARHYGYTQMPVPAETSPRLPTSLIVEQLSDAGLTVVETEVTVQHSTMAEKKAWLSIPVFARPTGAFTHAQRMEILNAAYTLTSPDAPTATSWLVVVAELPRGKS